MTQKNVDQISVYVTQDKQAKKLVPRAVALGKKTKRSVNFLVLEAIEEFLDRNEK